MRKTILCIDDDRETAALVAAEFTKRGYDMTVASDGHEGFAAVLRLRPDIVLCDVCMPILSGFEVRNRLIALSVHSTAIPFIFLTEPMDRDSQLRVRRLGVDAYVIKPLEFNALEAVISGCLMKIRRTEPWSWPLALTDREVECISWAACGNTSTEIAKIIGSDDRNVDFHIENACRKLNVSTRLPLRRTVRPAASFSQAPAANMAPNS